MVEISTNFKYASHVCTVIRTSEAVKHRVHLTTKYDVDVSLNEAVSLHCLLRLVFPFNKYVVKQNKLATLLSKSKCLAKFG